VEKCSHGSWHRLEIARRLKSFYNVFYIQCDNLEYLCAILDAYMSWYSLRGKYSK
jgi:hypothetical protein